MRELIREKQIRAVKIGQWRVKHGDLEEFVRARMNRQKELKIKKSITT